VADLRKQADVNTLELAWAAGFFDGEGHVSASKQAGKRACNMCIQIAQTDPEVLHRFQRAVGGLGRVVGPHNYGWRDVWTFRVNRFEHVQAIVAMLWPFLSGLKRADAHRALSEMAAWRAEKAARAAMCQKDLHVLAEVGRTTAGSCAACARDRHRESHGWKGGLPSGDRTHCPAGHAYEGDNLYVVPQRGVRHCRACTRENARKYRARQAATAALSMPSANPVVERTENV